MLLADRKLLITGVLTDRSIAFAVARRALEEGGDVVDRVGRRHPLGAAGASETGLPAGVPVSLGYVDVVCNALGAGLYDPAPEVGCTIIGSTGMHMRLASSADAVTLNAEATGYTMPFPVPGHYAQMQSNMAATLNIDWLLDLALGVLASEGVTRSRADLIRRLDERVMQARPGEVVFHPFISDAGERGPFVAHDRFVVQYDIDVTDKSSKKRMQISEVGVYTVKEGKIVREEFLPYAGQG
jgi:sugar (pentulose or hexulose) kinase